MLPYTERQLAELKEWIDKKLPIPLATRELTEENMKKRYDALRIIKTAQLPEALITANLDNHRSKDESTEDILRGINKYVDEFPANNKAVIHESANKKGNVLLFVGPCGVGKTRLACAILSELAVRHSTWGIYVSELLFYQQVKKALRQDAPIDSDGIVQLYANSEFLIIDDVAAVSSSEFEEKRFRELIEARISSRKPTLYITNYSQEMITKDLGERVADRIMLGAWIFMFSGNSQRKPVAVYGAKK